MNKQNKLTRLGVSRGGFPVNPDSPPQRGIVVALHQHIVHHLGGGIQGEGAPLLGGRGGAAVAPLVCVHTHARDHLHTLQIFIIVAH